jgi:hypothetical protein
VSFLLLFKLQEYPSVSRHYDFHIHGLIEPVHLVQQLNQNSLDFPIRPSLSIKPPSRNCVDFVDKNNRRRILSSHSENISNHSGTFSQVLLDEFRADHPDEGSLLKNETTVVWWATAFAIMVLPVPGGPYIKTPLIKREYLWAGRFLSVGTARTKWAAVRPLLWLLTFAHLVLRCPGSWCRVSRSHASFESTSRFRKAGCRPLNASVCELLHSYSASEVLGPKWIKYARNKSSLK